MALLSDGVPENNPFEVPNSRGVTSLVRTLDICLNGLDRVSGGPPTVSEGELLDFLM